MTASTRVSWLIAPALVLVLAGCTGGEPAPGASTEATPPAATVSPPDDTPVGRGDTACLISAVWGLDVDDSITQLATYLGTSGMAVIGSEGVGAHRVIFTEDGLVSSDMDVSYTLTIDMTGGLTLTMVQTQSGVSGGEWFWLDDTNVVGFENWDNGSYQIQTQTFINDTASPNSITVPAATLDGSKMEILSCTPDTLQTHADGSPFTQLWHAVND